MSALARRHGLAVVEIHGLPFLAVDEQRFVDVIVAECQAGRGGWAVTPNADIVRLTHQDEDIRRLVSSADALVADGMPLVWASRVQRQPLPGRVCGSDLISSLPRAAARAGLPIFLLGGGDDTAERTAEILTERNPGLRVVGTYAPPFGFESMPRQYEQMRERIAAAGPAIVFVALSFPKGEHLIREIRTAQPDAWWVGVGAAFDFVSGRIDRAPRWMQRVGAEWLHRVVQDPRRLARRYFLHDLPFVTLLFGGALRQRFGLGRSKGAIGGRAQSSEVTRRREGSPYGGADSPGTSVDTTGGGIRPEGSSSLP